MNEIIAVDFDGTCVVHRYPEIGEEVPYCVDILNLLVENNYKIVLNTMRGGKELNDAINWFKERNIPLYGANETPGQRSWTSSPKIWAQLYIDDAALGCPLKRLENGHIVVDWVRVKMFLINNNYF